MLAIIESEVVARKKQILTELPPLLDKIKSNNGEVFIRQNIHGSSG